MDILFITCSRIGDAVLTTGVLGFIVHQFPSAKVTVATGPLTAPLFADYPLLDRIIIFEKQRYARHWLYLWRQLKGRRWDLVFDLRGSVVSYGLRCRQRFVWRQQKNDVRHKVEQICSLAQIPTTPPGLWFDENRLAIAGSLLKEGHHYLAVAPAANWVGKQWPIERFAEIAQRFCQACLRAKIVLVAAPHERQVVDNLVQQLPASRLINLVNSGYDLGQIGACLQRCHLFLGNDSGLMHMAAAVKIPTIGLFGPSREENYGPYPISSHKVVRIPLSYDDLKKTPGFSHQSQDCYMTSLSTEMVWQAVQERAYKIFRQAES